MKYLTLLGLVATTQAVSTIGTDCSTRAIQCDPTDECCGIATRVDDS